jgi:hypothetical protein
LTAVQDAVTGSTIFLFMSGRHRRLEAEILSRRSFCRKTVALRKLQLEHPLADPTGTIQNAAGYIYRADVEIWRHRIFDGTVDAELRCFEPYVGGGTGIPSGTRRT